MSMTCLTPNLRLAYSLRLKKKKRQTLVSVMFYHLTTMKIRIIKKFHKRRIVEVGHGNPEFAFFGTEGVYKSRFQG